MGGERSRVPPVPVELSVAVERRRAANFEEKACRLQREIDRHLLRLEGREIGCDEGRIVAARRPGSAARMGRV